MVIALSSSIQRWYFVASLILVLGAVYYVIRLALLFHRLPVEVPVHFDLSREPNGWMNRALWSVVSIATIVFIILLSATTWPVGTSSLATAISLTYWAAGGLVLGAFLEINISAADNRKYRFIVLGLWALAVPFTEYILAIMTKTWWQK